MRVSLSRPDITEKEIQAVCEVLRTPNLSLGPKLTEFEKAFTDYIGVKRAVAVNSGTSGLFMCLKAMGIGPGDEVITTPFTFISSTTVIMMTGAKPVFVDIDPVSMNIDHNKIEEKINKNTKAILPVEVFGNPVGIDKVCQIAQKHNLLVMEDSCEALGSTLNGKKTGSFGKMSTFAFYPNKQMTTGEGGIILTDSDDLADTCMALRNQGRHPKSGAWLSHQMLGYNYRLSDINCALGIVQLSRIDEFIEKRKRAASYYQNILANDSRVTVPTDPKNCDISWFVFVIRLNENYTREHRDAILKEMISKGVQVSNYFTPVHLQPFIAEELGHKVGDFPVTDQICQRTIALPFYNNLTEEEATLVCNTLKMALDKLG